MEHRLILGGDQYLPFARSRVRALKALGLPYVDQSFEVDGVSIKVRIEPGHEYIRLEGNPTAYLESGQLEWTFPGELNPERYDPAKWHFLDIPATDKYLGWAQTSPPKKTGTQKNKPDLYEGMPSIAVGYPQGEDADKNAETKAKYADTTIVKKLIANYFPASLFSGKMRLFMQAQYGGREKIQSYGLEIGLVGTSAVLKYRGRNGKAIQFGVYSHISPGIFTAPDGSYWLISIRTNLYSTLYEVDAYPISTTPGASGMKAALKSPELTADERRNIEAYLFAEAEIDTDSPIRIGSFTARMESAIGYGWKWNTDGSKAAVVVHEFKGTGASDNRWVARTIQMGITYEKDEASGSFVFRATAETTLHGEWTDGWGTFNIFTTEDDPPVGGRLELWSLAINIFGRKPAFAFSDVSVYGYFVNDVWAPVTLSRTLRLDPVYTQSDTGIFYGPGLNMGVENRYQYGYLPASSSCTYRAERVTQGTEMSISFDGFSYLGRQRTGTFTVYTKDVAPIGSAPNPIDYVSANLTGVSYSPGDPPGYFSGVFHAGDTTVATARVTRTWTSWAGYANDAWALIIPKCDAEAVYISTHAYDGSDLVTTSFVASTGITSFSGEGGSFSPWSNAGSNNDWNGITANQTTGGNTDPRPESTTYVFNFNSVIHGVLGVPGGSYYALFNVDYNYPFYDRGMYTFTSAGGRYAMSEGLMFPGSVNFRHRFVGWA